MSIRVTGRNSFPTKLNLGELKAFPEHAQDALDAIMIAKAASEGTLEDVAQLALGIRSNAAITKPIDDLTKVVGLLMQQVQAMKNGDDIVEEEEV